MHLRSLLLGVLLLMPAAGAAGEEGVRREAGIGVFVTPFGRSYHAAGCRYLAENVREVLRHRAARKLRPCRVCRPDGGRRTQAKAFFPR
jgi:hypothetical protein